MVEVRTYKKQELADMEWKSRDTIWVQTDKYIPIHIYNNRGNVNKSWFQLRYIKKEDLDNYIKEQEKIEHKWAKKN